MLTTNILFHTEFLCYINCTNVPWHQVTCSVNHHSRKSVSSFRTSQGCGHTDLILQRVLYLFVKKRIQLYILSAQQELLIVARNIHGPRAVSCAVVCTRIFVVRVRTVNKPSYPESKALDTYSGHLSSHISAGRTTAACGDGR
jgi:hypothetical protein